LYTTGEVIHETWIMKLYPVTLVVLQVSELACYIFLFQLVSKHDDQMRKNKIISSDSLHKRKQKNLFSMYAQASGFALEIVYLFFSICHENYR